MNDWLCRLAEIEAQLPENAEFRFKYAIRHGSMKCGLYAPRGDDTQSPHKQDELYIIVSGRGMFTKAGDARPFIAGDVIFVEAGLEHRFSETSEDFASWVVFWGPEGGESAAY